MSVRPQLKKPESLHSLSELKNMTNNSNQRIKTYNETHNYFCEELQVGLEEDRVAVVIDGTSLYKISKTIEANLSSLQKFSMDYKVLSDILSTNFPNIKRKWFIVSQTITKSNEDNNGYSAIRSLLDWLEYHQYTVVTRDIIVDALQNEEERKIYHHSMDIEITTALFKAASIADRVVFFGSDRKWEIPLKVLRDEYNKSITVVSAMIPSGRRIVADELRKIDHFVDLNTPWFHEAFKRRDNFAKKAND